MSSPEDKLLPFMQVEVKNVTIGNIARNLTSIGVRDPNLLKDREAPEGKRLDALVAEIAAEGKKSYQISHGKRRENKHPPKHRKNS
jgi:hypothetical protein